MPALPSCPPPTANPGPTGRILIISGGLAAAQAGRCLAQRDGHQVTRAPDAATALQLVTSQPPDLVITGPLPGLDPPALCQRLQARGPTPVIIIAAGRRDTDKIAAFAAGADDYLTTPASPAEIAWRARALLRRTPPASPAPRPLADGDLTIDPAARQARLGGRPLPLTTREYQLLEFLLRHPGQAYTRSQLLAQVWQWTHGGAGTVTVHIRRLRAKLEPDPAHPARILTVHGHGYRYQPTAS